MRQIKDIILLFIYSFFSAFFLPVNAVYVLIFLSAITVVTSTYFFNRRSYSMAVGILFFAAGLFFVPCLGLFPLVSYDTISRRLKIPALIGAVTFLFRANSLSLSLTTYILFGLLLSFCLSKQTEEYERLDKLYKQTRDDTTELNLLLKEKNKNLLEKQDYEIYTATLRERNRIAREIHDNVGHMLSRSILMVGALRAVNHDNTLAEPLSNLENTLTQAMDSVRQSVHDLHDESVNLKEAVENLIQGFVFCPASLQYDMGYQIPRELKYSFIAIIKEALVNVSKHSNATHVSITLREHPGFWQLSIADNGTLSGNIASTGIGLENIRGRILALNGRVDITKDNGFHIFATVPKENS